MFFQITQIIQVHVILFGTEINRTHFRKAMFFKVDGEGILGIDF